MHYRLSTGAASATLSRMTTNQSFRRSLMRTLALFVLAVALTTPPSPPVAASKPISTIAHTLPVHGKVLRDYAPPEKRWQSGHRGVDLNASPGQPIRASAPGTVHFAGPIAGMTSLSIMHVDGIRTTYQPIDTALKKGDHVTAGQVIGHLAVNAKHPEPGLHWGALRGKDYLNPLDLVQRRPIVLKPVRH